MATQTEEDYLKALYMLDGSERSITLTELSKRLGVSTPTANSMVKKLHAQALIEYQRYRPIKLTPRGRLQAALIVRKHRLTEMYLVERMGFGWEQVHEIAEQVEHIQSPIFFERMDELLGFPQLDPHGSPIPDKDGKIQSRSYRRLSEVPVGKSYQLAALAHSSNEFLHFLNERELTLGMQIRVLSRESYDGSLRVSFGGRSEEVLSLKVSEQLLVE